jgi:hypothetical protein
MFFIHGGAGDEFTFTVDFGEKSVDAMSYMSYGLAAESTDFDLFINDELQGSGEGLGGNGWELEDYNNANYDEFKFAKPVTGLCTVKIQITSSSPAWPANNIGMFTFYEAAPATPTPEAAATDEPSAPTDAPTEAPTAAPTDVPATEAATAPEKTADNSGKTADNKPNAGLIAGISIGAAVLVAAVVIAIVVAGKKKKAK